MKVKIGNWILHKIFLAHSFDANDVRPKCVLAFRCAAFHRPWIGLLRTEYAAHISVGVGIDPAKAKALAPRNWVQQMFLWMRILGFCAALAGGDGTRYVISETMKLVDLFLRFARTTLILSPVNNSENERAAAAFSDLSLPCENLARCRNFNGLRALSALSAFTENWKIHEIAYSSPGSRHP